MSIDEQTTQESFQLGQEVFDSAGNKLGKVQARFDRYLLVERGGLFGRTYYIPRSTISKKANGILYLGLSEEELREHGYNNVPDDLYEEVEEPGTPQVFSGVPKFARKPLSPAETGHYHYGRRWPGINTDAAGSYHREEVLPIPQKLVESSEDKRTRR
jgi:hypothetical protein